MKVWITKYALTNGIEEREVEVSSTYSTMATYSERSYTRYIHKPHWHSSEEEARTHAGVMKAKKIASLKKQIAKLEALKFD